MLGNSAAEERLVLVSCCACVLRPLAIACDIESFQTFAATFMSAGSAWL
jgi:hypothetical protein